MGYGRRGSHPGELMVLSSSLSLRTGRADGRNSRSGPCLKAVVV